MSIRDFGYSSSDSRSQTEKQHGMRDFVVASASIAAYLAARKKVALTRGVSRDIMKLGLGGEKKFSRLLADSDVAITTIRDNPGSRIVGMEKISQSGNSISRFMRDLAKPLPSASEQYDIAKLYLNKYLDYPVHLLPRFEELGITGRGVVGQIIHGLDIVPISPKVPIGIGSRHSGKFGSILIQNKMHMLRDPLTASKYRSPFFGYVGGVKAGHISTWGGTLETERRSPLSPFRINSKQDFVRKVELNAASVLESEMPSFIREEYMGRFFPQIGHTPGMSAKESISWAEGAYKSSGDPSIPTLENFWRRRVALDDKSVRSGSLTYGRLLRKRAAKTRKLIAKNAVSKSDTLLDARYGAFRVGRKIGIGEEFARPGKGVLDKAERFVREGLELNYKHPVTGKTLNFSPEVGFKNSRAIIRDADDISKFPSPLRQYSSGRKHIGSRWGDYESPWYFMASRDTKKQWANLLSPGTFMRTLENAFGIGVKRDSGPITDFITELIGSKKGSYSNLFIRDIGRTARVLSVGFGAYYTYRMVDYLARKATGWGPTDFAATSYANARRFQQSVLQMTGVSSAAGMSEKMFPGSVNSPLSRAARFTSPLWMGKVGHKFGGRPGMMIGLSLGIATALISWGDITQSPDELHRIFTGEQEIPVRKGRYWLLGKTPFFGGKISYWRQHWYPLMKSRYKYKGGVWDSEEEYWMHGSPISPLISPIIGGQPWDPYHWERKHYKDRPYPVTGELFEPTMPLAWLGNMTIGKVLKPQVLMHKNYLGQSQSTGSERDRGVPMGAGASLGLGSLGGGGVTNASHPGGVGNLVGMGLYTQAEQMGLSGFILNSLNEKLTGQQDFMGSGSILQSARRATGYERSYWERDIGDPGAGLDEGATEFFRRVLPHRRTNVDEYNPIPNLMPDWLPGEDYFTNFKTGDPYVKVPFGEARLPGPGYEALHRLHSGIPKVYDAVDRYMILSNVAPYSKEYEQYKALAKGMVKGDSYWENKMKLSEIQRTKLSKEYDFLDTSAKDVPSILRPISSMYRHVLSGVTDFPNPLDVIPHAANVGPIPTHINKWLPYKTPESAYREFRMYGSEFTRWDQPISSFVTPYMRRVRGFVDPSYVPEEVEQRRDIQEYFDKLKFVKYSNLSQLARAQGNSMMASKLMSVAKRTMQGGGFDAGSSMRNAPKEEKSFIGAFSSAEGERRHQILNIVPSYMRNYYMTAWNESDKKNGGSASYDIDYEKSKDLTGYFRNHNLPPSQWLGWHPDVNLDQVKLRVVKNEAMDMHKLNLWESNERQLARQPFTPTIDRIDRGTGDMAAIQNLLVANMEKMGFNGSNVFISRTPSDQNSYRINLRVSKDNRKKHERAMREVLTNG